ncbi:hypothetical protein K432DRAFT_430726 [Lepidopterella palustris CBS 459.81]|uniref:Uncharacterized protein n=1 Tax=Lepidopterella palustris CBS 459.81 TaxID=1314670 RepID=A0A8E2DWN4_9PEZI|nr:hypothetical protein K432DRAFT_430726 [Lepidopterella palustris CBS 459.81]
MAPPPESVSTKNFSGKWIFNRHLSNDAAPLLALEGVGWLIRKAIGIATITMHIYQAPDPPTITCQQHVTGGIKGTTEVRVLDWKYAPRTDYVFGDVSARTRLIKLDEVAAEGEFDAEDVAFLKEGMGDGADLVLETVTESAARGWVERQTWAVTELDGERRYVRRMIARKKKEVQRVVMVFDWAGAAE